MNVYKSSSIVPIGPRFNHNLKGLLKYVQNRLTLMSFTALWHRAEDKKNVSSNHDIDDEQP